MFQGRLRAPDLSAAVDVEAHIARLPADATSKGMFFNALLDRASGHASRGELLLRAGLPATTRLVAFRDYPMAANMRLTVEVARLLYPREPLGRALNELGRVAVAAFQESHLGRIFLDSLELDPETLFRAAPRIYNALFNFGRISYEPVGQRHGRFTVRGMPIFIETFQVGSMESVLKLTRSVGTITVALDSLSDGTVDVCWR
jgi:uncharacterized protein (TIGR02265 family)